MPSDRKVIVTNRVFPETLSLLAPHARLEVNETGEPWSYEETRRRSADADAVLSFMTDKIDAGFIDGCPNLHIIGAALKGYDNIDVEAAERAGVWVTIVPDLLTVPTAELAIGLMLALGRNVLKGDAGIRAQGFSGWRPSLYGTGLAGATVGLVGFGRVGQAIAARLAAFDCRILAFDMRESEPHELNGAVSFTGLPDLLGQADYVVLALPLKPETQHIIDHGTIACMKPGALLINPARGSLVDERAVADAIERRHLGGYATDVFECEDWARDDRPTAIDPRLTARGAPTVLTPHIGSAVTSVRREIELSAARSIVAALSDQIPPGAINNPKTTNGHAQPRSHENISHGA